MRGVLIHASRVVGLSRDLRRHARKSSASLAAAALAVGVCGVTAGRSAAAAPAGPQPLAVETAEPSQETETTAAAPAAPKPPRLDGPYIGGIVMTGLSVTRVNDLETGPFAAYGGSFRFGEMVLPWLGLGLSLGGSGGTGNGDARQSLGQGQFLVDAVFVPLAKRRVPLSLRASFGFGAGAVREQGVDGRSGFGGAAFAGSVAYTFFPWANKKRQFKGGGFGLGPELGWWGFPPTAPGRPMANAVMLGLTTTFYFGS